jgi:molecular chaperone GrpE
MTEDSGHELDVESAAEASDANDAAENDPTAQELERLQSELDVLNDRHLRLAAEFENFRRRSHSELGQSGTRAQAQLVGRLVEVLDDFERFETLDLERATVESVMEGMDLVGRKLHQTLQEAGLEELEPVGEPFDPQIMEAMLRETAESEEEDDIVSRVLQRGFRFRGHLVRPARVSVLKHD